MAKILLEDAYLSEIMNINRRNHDAINPFMKAGLALLDIFRYSYASLMLVYFSVRKKFLTVLVLMLYDKRLPYTLKP